ncbi:MAG: hypothetical protein NE334_12960 [Lentisphaeraceae bacterium]|nr:hypothetical protein [Lentisphaeraceae bacterium]
MGLFKKNLSGINTELKLIAKLCKENPKLKNQLIFVLSQTLEKRQEMIEQWIQSLPAGNDFQKGLSLLKENELAEMMLAELEGMSDAQ